MTRVCGIDPSLTSTGIADPDGDAFVVTFKRHEEDDLRLRRLHLEVADVARWSDLAVVEDLPVHGQGAGKTGMAQGVVRHALLSAGVPYVLVAPATLKKFATSRGNATKPDMRMEWFRRTGSDVRDDNEGDALWLRQLGLHLLGEPEFALPKTHTVALAKVSLPVDFEVVS